MAAPAAEHRVKEDEGMRTLYMNLLLLLALPAAAEVNITDDLPEVQVLHGGQPTLIRRNPDGTNTIAPDYALTSRDCPPFCIQPMQLAPGVETLGEVELIEWLKRASAGEPVLVIDSRTPDWVARGTIPGAVNIPWTRLSSQHGADPFTIADILEKQFGAVAIEGLWDFSRARTLVLFCNGMWCGQSPTNIRALLRYGYPAEKLKWYRGGMQDWHALGLTVVPPADAATSEAGSEVAP
jgi:rhodanese-related sulfurtransferase